MKRRTVLAAAAVVTAGCAELIPGGDTDSAPAPDSDEWDVRQGVEGSIAGGSASNLVLEDHDYATAGEHARVRGTVRNTDSESAPGAEVDVTLLSEEGTTVDETEREHEEELAPDESWRFVAIFANVNVEAVERYTIETGGT